MKPYSVLTHQSAGALRKSTGNIALKDSDVICGVVFIALRHKMLTEANP